jgi:tetratricopeptide (TPR) repeat protein
MTRTSGWGKWGVLLLGLALAAAWLAPSEALAAKATPRGAAEAESKDPVYWFQRGALCATYGNNQAAVRYFGRAIALDPGRSAPFFSQGVSYGQLGQYEKAFAAINRAIEMEPRNGLYYYGRARTHLLAGDRQRAMQDFRTAAELGDEDAQAYLKTVK